MTQARIVACIATYRGLTARWGTLCDDDGSSMTLVGHIPRFIKYAEFDYTYGTSCSISYRASKENADETCKWMRMEDEHYLITWPTERYSTQSDVL